MILAVVVPALIGISLRIEITCPDSWVFQMHTIRTSCSLLILLIVADTLWAGRRYMVHSIGDLPTERIWISPSAINDLGQIVGQRHTDTGFRGILWDAGIVVDLGDLPGENAGCSPVNINNYGQIVGVGFTEFGYRPIHWASGSFTDLATLSARESGAALGINAFGAVVGNTYDSDSRLSYPFSWSASAGFHRFVEPRPVENTLAIAINDSGLIAGYKSTAGVVEAVIWQGASTTVVNAPPGMSRFLPLAMNNSGFVVGGSLNNNASELATLWKSSEALSLGDLPGGVVFSRAFSINDLGEVVGSSADEEVTAFSETKAFYWNEGVMRDLNEMIDRQSGWVLYNALDINNRGEIVGMGMAPNGRGGGFLLTPVPEPSSLTLLALFAGGIAIRLFRSRARIL
ncbi:MAG: hypothetical protein SGJ19_22890 [Planctomycetia bacterium]|nr:hypothetical protein [Planctomycetia bacterium]